MSKPQCTAICELGCRKSAQCCARSSVIIDGKPLCKVHAFAPLMRIMRAAEAWLRAAKLETLDLELPGHMCEWFPIVQDILAGHGPGEEK